MTDPFEWWKHGVIYQIYPRSFYDSNGDGVGDIPGIIEKLDYLSYLGVDAIWLSPINASPMYDCGYDISDYYAIDPVFGSSSDFDRLVDTAHSRGIRIIMDLVLNHTSHLHRWFLSSRSSRSNPMRNWYLWRDGEAGRPPNNWRSAFGGSAWKWDEMTCQYYLHSFLEEQPDLNWRDEGLRAAVFRMIRHWLDRGVDGFRLDVVNWLIKDRRFRNNQSLPGIPFFQKHRYDRNRPETHDILRELRLILDEYDGRMAVGEVFTLPPGDPVLSASYLGSGHDELHLAFDFSLMYRPWSARRFYRALRRWTNAVPEDGWPCHVLSNHDQTRSMSRYGREGDREKRALVAATLLMTIRGTPFLYYGEEIGMQGWRIPRSDMRDPLGKRYWPLFAGRDPARTPMQWSPGDNAGFSAGRPWLPIGVDYPRVNVETERADRYSILNYYRSLIAVRRASPALRIGSWEPVLKGYHGTIGYYRRLDGETVFVALNFTDKSRRVHVHDRGQWIVLLSSHRSTNTHFTSLEFTLSPYEATILKKIGPLPRHAPADRKI